MQTPDKQLTEEQSREVADKIREELLKLRTESRYREAAQRIQAQLLSLHGTTQAASIVEEKLSSQMAFDSAMRETVTQ